MHICEIDEGVINASKAYLPQMACGFDDPRVKVHIQDGAAFMREKKGEFDVIICDTSDPIGPAEVLACAGCPRFHFLLQSSELSGV